MLDGLNFTIVMDKKSIQVGKHCGAPEVTNVNNELPDESKVVYIFKTTVNVFKSYIHELQ